MKNNTNIFSLLNTHIDSFIYETSENCYEIMYQHQKILYWIQVINVRIVNIIVMTMKKYLEK